MTSRENRLTVVSGDVTMDWNLAREPLSHADENAAVARASWQRGGAALLADLLQTIAAALPPDTERQSLVAYDKLADYKKEEDLRTVRDIPTKLAGVGCVMVPGRADLPQIAFTDDEVETMAELEHDLGMRGLGPGWRHGEVTDKRARVHVAYLPWDEPPEEQRDKDRNLVRELSALLHKAGYTVVRVGRAQGS